MRPSPSTTVALPVLSEYFREYVEQAATRLAGLQALPIVKVADRTGDITIMRREAELKTNLDQAREARGTYNRIEWDFEKMTYRTEEYGLEMPLDEAEVAQYEKYINIRENSARLLVDQILRGQEKRIADELFSATTFSGYTGDITNAWNDAANATPKADIDTKADSIAGQCGMYPTHLLMSYKVFLNVMKTNEIKNYSQYTSTLLASPIETQRQWLSNYLGVEVILGGAFYDSAKEGSAASLVSIWDDEYALLFVKSPSLGLPGIGWTLLWSADSPENVNAEEYVEPQTRSTVLRCRQHSQSNVFAAEFGYLLGNVTHP